MSESNTKIASLAKVDALHLRRELQRRDRLARTVFAKRTRLLARLRDLDKTIADLGIRSDGSVGRAPRARNELSLVEALARILKGKQLGLAEIEAGLPGVGYQSRSVHLRNMINAALARGGPFRRVRRGVYSVK